VTAAEDLARDYRVAFLRYLSRRDEPALAGGYELGRRALARGTSLLDVVQVHHVVLAEVSRGDADDPADVPLAASQFLLEVLASFEMARTLGSPPRG
jgi:hypothetical protein